MNKGKSKLNFIKEQNGKCFLPTCRDEISFKKELLAFVFIPEIFLSACICCPGFLPR